MSKSVEPLIEEVKSTRGGDHGEMKTRTFPR